MNSNPAIAQSRSYTTGHVGYPYMVLLVAETFSNAPAVAVLVFVYPDITIVMAYGSLVPMKSAGEPRQV